MDDSTHPLPQAVLTSSRATRVFMDDSTHPLPQAVLTSSRATRVLMEGSSSTRYPDVSGVLT
jgi:hypothetical protein